MTDGFQVPQEMRAFAEKSLDQARQAVDGFMSAMHQAMGSFGGQADFARFGTKEVSEKAMQFAQANIASGFDLTRKIMQAKDMQEVLTLQADYIKTQMQVLAEQAKELGETASKAVKDVTPRR